MADRYWVGGTGTWSAAATANWSASSGGAGGASAPTSADNVFFDLNSAAGAYTVTLSGALCLDCTVTSDATVKPTFGGAGSLNIAGSLSTPSTNFTWSNTGNTTFSSTSTGRTITCGVTVSAAFIFNGVGGGWTLGGNLTLSAAKTTTLTNGAFSDGGFNFTLGVLGSSNSNTRSVTFGAGSLWTLSGSGVNVWNFDTSTNLTVTDGGATISLTSASAKTFKGGGKSWPVLNNGGAGTLTITGANTFSDLTNTVQPTAFVFPASTTTTVSAFSLTGTSGNLVTITSSTAGTAATLSKSSGTVNASYLSLKDSTATGGATWNALNSTNVSGNTGWNFSGGTTPVTLTVTQGKTVSVTKQAQWGKTLTAASSTSLVKQAQALRSVTQASTITLATMRLANVVLSIVQATSTTLLKTAIKPLAVAQAAAASATKMIAKEVLLAGTSSALVSKTVAQTRALSQGTSVSLAKTIGQVRAVVAAAATAGVIKMASRTFGLNTAVIVRMLRNGAVWPDPADVAEGVLYGPNGSDYVGTKKGGGGYFRRR